MIKKNVLFMLIGFITLYSQFALALAPVANFNTSATNVMIGGSVGFYSTSSNSPTTYAWTFPGGTPATSNLQNPTVTYANAGVYDVTLIVSNIDGADTITQTNLVIAYPVAPTCTELFFSEYYEGVSNDKVLEIYNPSNVAVNLSGYNVSVYANGSATATGTINLTGSIAAHDVYVLVNNNANTTITAIADLNTGVCNFNGNDAVALKFNGTILDVIGEIGVNPGTAWTVGSASTLDYDLVRNTSVNGPTNSWASSQVQWTSFALGTITNIGSHSSSCSSSQVGPTPIFTSNTTNINAGSSVNFTDISTGNPSAWLWSFPGGSPSTSTSQNPTITYSTPGVYSVSLLVTNASGFNSTTVQNYITVNAVANPPVAAFTANSTNITVSSSVTFTNQSTNSPSAYSWSFPGGTPATSTATNPVITYNAAGTYDVTLIAISAGGSDTLIQTAYITVQAASNTCNELFFSEYYEGSASDKALEIYNPTGAAFSLTGYTIATYTNGATTPNATYTLTGSIAAHDVFIVANASANATILALADATSGVCSFNGNDAIALLKNGTAIDIIGEIGVNPGTSWTVGTGSTFDNTLVRNTSVTGPTTSWSTGQLQWTNYPLGTSSYLGSHNGACGTGGNPPTAVFTANVTTVATGGAVQFSDTSTDAPTIWSWIFPGGTPATSTAQNPIVSYSTSGTYAVTLIVTNNSGTDTTTITNYINVMNNIPCTTGLGGTCFSSSIRNVTISGTTLQNISSSCNYVGIDAYAAFPATGSTTATLNIGQAYNFNVTCTNNSVIAVWIDYNHDGVFGTTEYTLIVSSGGNNSAATQSISIPTTALPGATLVRVRARTSGNQINPSDACTYMGSGETEDYTITLAGAVVLPTAAFTNTSTTVCTNESVTFNNTSTNAALYAWTFSGGTPATSTSQNPSVSWSTAGTKTITLIASNANGSDTLIQNIVVTAAPTASIISAMGATTFCEGNSLMLMGNTNGTWSNGSTASSIFVNQSGTYSVTSTNACGSSTSNAIVVTVNPLPVASNISAMGATSFCNGESVMLMGNNGGTWSNGSTAADIMVSTAGVYSVTTTNACGTTTSNSITINILQTPTAPVISAMGATTFCEGNSLMLMGNTNGTWSNGSTASSIFVNQSGTYSVTSTNACGSSTSNAIVATVNPLPAASVISAIGSITFCSGGSVTLTGNSNGTWSNGSTNASITVSQSGPYYVTNVNACGAVNSDTINITVLDSPVASVIAANGASTICSGDSITLNGNNGGVWNTGSTAPSISVSQAGNYFVTTANNCGSVNSNSIAITVNTVDTAVLVGNASLLANASNASYQWLLCNGVFNPIAGETNQTFQPTMISGFYAVAITQNGCSDTSSCHVFIYTDVQSENEKSNALFTVYPNPSNAMITIQGTARQHIIIQNALGEVVFSKTNCDASENVDVRGFAEGVYFIKSNLRETKFIKQ